MSRGKTGPVAVQALSDPEKSSENEHPKVSVIVPIYNTGRYLQSCLESIGRQSYSNLEVLLIDDGSTDDSGRTCEEFASTDSRVRVIHKINEGLSSARNIGIELSTGDYLFFLDGDDLIGERGIEALVDLAIAENTDVVVSNLARIREKSEFHGNVSSGYVIESGRDCLQRLLLLDGETGSACGKLFSSALFHSLRFPMGRYFEDAGVVSTILSVCERVCITDSVVYGYVVREGSITVRKSYSMKHIFDAERTLSDMRNAASRCGLFREFEMAEAYSRVRIAAKIDSDIVSNNEIAKLYTKRARVTAARAAVSRIGLIQWRLRCILFACTPKLYKTLLETYSKWKIAG